MSSEGGEIVLTIDLRKLLVLSVIFVFTVVSVGSYLIALFAFDAPSADLPLRARSEDITVMDKYANPKSSFSPGEQLDISVVVEMALRYAPTYYYFVSGVNYTVIITIMDPYNKPILFVYEDAPTLDPDKTSTFILKEILGEYYTIPEDAEDGDYTINVMAWSDWLPDGVTRIQTVEPLERAQFTVTS